MRVVVALLALMPSLAWAHSFGRQYNLPVPLWLYVYGGAAALALSFFLAAFMLRGEQHLALSRRYRLYRKKPSRQVVARSLSVMVLLLTIATGLFGNRDPYVNFSMTFFWIVFLLGFAYVCTLFGDRYRDINPFVTLAKLVMPSRWQRGLRRYPRGLNYWPAFVAYLGLIWVELFTHNTPMSLGQMLAAYTLYTVLAMWLFGVRSWARHGELFSVMFRLMALMSPLHNGRRQLSWQAPFSGMLREQPRHLALLFFVLFLLSATAFDGLRATSWWVSLFWHDRTGWLTAWMGSAPIYNFVTLRPYYFAFESAVLLLSPFIYGVFYWLSMALAKGLTGSALSTRELCLRFAYSLLPIALVYNITHYYTLIFTQGVKIVSMLSDPFGWGWNVFGSAGLWRAPIIPDVAVVWHTQVGLIVLGHVISVYIGHRIALRSFATARQATLSQLPLLVLMMAFTASGLWILAQPIGAR
ncbi:hypothetical protein DFR26_0065 [Paraperlucidibaca baekdonensis]|uniref:Fenitrothion hydrolase FedB n=1 Tax=Paraperlucidibaca baekdonensis TaxID=748120 RepID=A0A3E0H806_9GAMM|nr:hypothetical protein [Paraperlucidibaca baekdonensis]REH39871.1 hypothetical protein DFR26_0065 [Paraperlucidibaca baekdonensis]